MKINQSNNSRYTSLRNGYNIIYEYIDSTKCYSIRTDFFDGKKNGLFYLLDGHKEQIQLFDNDTLIGEISLYDGKSTFMEYFRNGNIFVNRLFNKNGDIVAEEISYDKCVYHGFYRKNKKKILLKKESFSALEYCDKELIKYYQFLNYAKLSWFKDFTGTEFKSLFVCF